MPNYIVLRLIPASPMTGADFANLLNGLEVKVFDISYTNPGAGLLGNNLGEIGSAKFNAPSPNPALPPTPFPLPLLIGNPLFVYPANTGVVQHYTPRISVFPMPGLVEGANFQAVATAVIGYQAPGLEYPPNAPGKLPDLRIRFLRAGTMLVAPGVFYDVRLYTSPAGQLQPTQYQGLAESDVAAYVELPEALDPNLGSVLMSEDGTPPSYDQLLLAVEKVLKSDPGPVGHTLAAEVAKGPLTADRCRNIAYEILWGPQPDLPVPPGTLEDLYTKPTNDGTTTNPNEQHRAEFEGKLKSFYAIRNTQADRLSKYVFALSCGAWCNLQSTKATRALLQFPVNPGAISALTTVKEAEVILTGALGIDVPAEYFYALGAQLPMQITAEQRYALACGAGVQANLTLLKDAEDAGVIAVNPAMNPAQAARIIDTLKVPNTSASVACPIGTLEPPIWTDFKAFPPAAVWTSYKASDDGTGFWQPEAAGTPAKFLDLVLWALTGGHGNAGKLLGDSIKQGLGVAQVGDIPTLTAQQWRNFFNSETVAPFVVWPNGNITGRLPAFTQPGTEASRISAFIRHVQKFFELQPPAVPVLAVGAGEVPVLDLPKNDLIQAAVAAAGIVFGAAALTPADLTNLDNAAQAAAPGDEGTQAWIVQTIIMLNELAMCVALAGKTPAFQFSLMEALYARGFTGIESILDQTQADFQQALTGTVAYDDAVGIYNNAMALGVPPAFLPPTSGEFKPINDGTLTNCNPPCFLSPLGPVNYLHEMLKVSESSTCDNPFAVPGGKQKTLGQVIKVLRGQLGKLGVTCANLETPLPRVDLVNECLEFMATTTPPTTHGTVYNTSGGELAAHKLCQDECCSCKENGEETTCHTPAKLFAAMPEYSTPAVPVAENAGVTPAVWDKLKQEFSTCCLPYSQALDVNRTYLNHFHTCRFETMRTFRKCITEWALDAENQPGAFQTHLWRYPVRIDIALEYLGITPEEYETLFQGVWPKKCGPQGDHGPKHGRRQPLRPWELYGLVENTDKRKFLESIVKLPEFLRRTCLSYCEFLELWKSEFVVFSNAEEKDGKFPDCEPCCLDKLVLRFPNERRAAEDLERLGIFIRLWRKLQELCTGRYTFFQLRDICEVLQLFKNGALNPNFIRQLAAFQMLRDQFQMPLTDPHDPPPPNAIDDERTHLLAICKGEGALKWSWCIERLIRGIEHYAVCGHRCPHRPPVFLKLLSENLKPLSLLAGFDPGVVADTWHAAPTHTLRFAEVLSKIYASHFTIGEILYLFTADENLNGDDPFPLQTENEGTEHPLDLPDDTCEHALQKLRRKLLDTRVPEAQAHAWTWGQVAAFLENEMGFTPATVLDLGSHFFPEQLISEGIPVGPGQRRFSSPLLPANTIPAMWNSPPLRPFHYDPAGMLWTELPLVDKTLFEQLIRVRRLNAQEQKAVRDLYFQPRASLAAFGFLFEDFPEAESRLIQELDPTKRWTFFQEQIALAQARCQVLAEHIAEHVAHVTGQQHPEAQQAATLVLRSLFAAENKAPANDWEDDLGQVPPVRWTPPPNGGAYAALLGLVGTGLLREFIPQGRPVAWRDVCGQITGFGESRNAVNCPVPTVLPALDVQLAPAQRQFVSTLNGFALKNTDGSWLGGAEGFEVKWIGALLIEKGGRYEFFAGGLAADGENVAGHQGECRRWRVLLKRGQRTWVLLNHRWPNEVCPSTACLDLECGAYEITIQFVQAAPQFMGPDEQICPQYTGLQLKYSGPDSEDQSIEIPHRQLFLIRKDDRLSNGIGGLADSAQAFLDQYYTSSLRDIRLTYQRAFKATLFAHRFALSATPQANQQSELGYMLERKDLFAGAAYLHAAPGVHLAGFDFNFLPLNDEFFPPTPAQDIRMAPSSKRKQALFDWWERTFDYTQARAEVHAHCNRALWLLFNEAATKQPAHPDYLLRFLGADSRHWQIDLRYYQDQASPIYSVSSADLRDDRWVIRAWHADLWVRQLRRFFRVKDITQARPDLWASLDPSALVNGEAVTGNANLSQFFHDGCLECGSPRLYEEVRTLNNGLRERGRRALLAYLCGPGGIAQRPRDLSDMLLIDVEAGLNERVSRVEDAISAIQTLIQRARLGLEPGWNITPAFARLWDSRFSTFHVWEACKRRELYKENWIDWHDLEKAKKVEAFQLLEHELSKVALTIATPGGVDYWPDSRPPQHDGVCLLQQREAATMKVLEQPRQGLNVLASQDRAGRATWLTRVPDSKQQEDPILVAGDRRVPALLGITSATIKELPFWMKSAIKLGRRFLRIAAAGYPAASNTFRLRTSSHHPDTEEERCVECCCECGCSHPPGLDEYYFWLVDARYFDPESQPIPTNDYDAEQESYYDANVQEATPWHDPTQLPALLRWPAKPMVRLAWCRVHNGEFQQPRLSIRGVPVSVGGQNPEIRFAGRAGDSLYLEVANAGGLLPGFRYDIATDSAKAFENLSLPANAPAPSVGNLWAYPYFAYHDPGAPIFPWPLQTPAVAVSNALRAHCRHEAALKWYQLAYNPLSEDNTWVRCRPERTPDDSDEHEVPDETPDDFPPLNVTRGPEVADPTAAAISEILARWEDVRGKEEETTTCCDSTVVPCRVARNRSVLLQYLETLVQWSDALMQRNSREAFEQARVLLDTAREVLGKPPRAVSNMPPSMAQTVDTFSPQFAPLNPRLLAIYERVDDQLALIHHSLNGRRLQNSEGRCCLPYWGNKISETCCEDVVSCCPPSPYRFLVSVQKAQELAGRVRELGAALLAAFEKGDAEHLGFMRARQEQELLVLGRQVRKNIWRDADWQVQALGKTKESAQASRRYYAQLIQNGKNNNEQGYENETQNAMILRATSNTFEGIAESMDIIPDMFVGFPCNETWLPLGTKLAGLFKTLARVTSTVADIANTNAGLHLTNGGWDRRLEEWIHQVESLDIQIEQVELQILGAERRRDQALRELNNQERQIKSSTEVLDFLRDKFSSQAVYLWLQQETAGLHYKMYELAMCAARQAEQAFNFERGHMTKKFIPCESWDNLHEGLLAGERLQLTLAQLEKEYMDLNVRERELTKHISLRQHFPFQFLLLKLIGRCEIQLPEWMFDQDYPGHYMRRIKNVSLSIPCVTGPYTGVHCRLTLLCSQTRIDPALKAPASHCCSDHHSTNGYEACCNDPRMVCQYGAKEAIATSSGQNDAGLFELNFRDERYLPFEFHGAVSRWRIELPPQNNYFDIETLSDVVMHLNYTSREGGEVLREAADTTAQQHFPGSGWTFLDIRHDFSDAWEVFRSSSRNGDRGPRLSVRLHRKLFPYLPRCKNIEVDKVVLLFETPCKPGCQCKVEPCPCVQDKQVAYHKVNFTIDDQKLDCGCGGQGKVLQCTASEEWNEYYCATVETKLHPSVGHKKGNELHFEFPQHLEEVSRVYLFCHYKAEAESMRANCCKTDAQHDPHHQAKLEPGGKPRGFQLP